MRTTRLLVIIIAAIALLKAEGIEGNFRSGIFFGTGLWSQTDFSEQAKIHYDFPNTRLVNQLRLRSKLGPVTWQINGSHNTGFANDSTISEAKIYQIMGRYDFSRGHLKFGRIPSLNRWYWGSYDGGAINYRLPKRIQINLFGGLGVPYGDWYDADNTEALVYGDIGYRKSVYGVKLKTIYYDESTRAGVDFWGRFKKLRAAGDYGYDFTNTRIADGGLNLSFEATQQLTLNANYRLFRSQLWDFNRLEFSYLTERFLFAAHYNLNARYYVSLKHVTSMNSDFRNNISYIVLGRKQLYASANYLTSDYGIRRFGTSIGGKLELFKGFWIDGALSPIDYKRRGSSDHIHSLVSYLKLRYLLGDKWTISTHWGLYNDIGSPDTVTQSYRDSRLRGQLFLSVKL